MTRWTISDEHIAHATQVVKRFAERTPLIAAPAFGARTWLKLETEQATGSFKVRGALARLSRLSRAERGGGVVTASAGNHGAGVAYAARLLCVPARVFVPAHAPTIKVDKIRRLGAEVIITDHDGHDATEAEAREQAFDDSVPFISPFDDPDVAAGNGSTIANELLYALERIDVIVLPVGGGGLLAGVVAAVQASGRDIRVVGVQSDACPAMTRSLEQGQPILTMDGEPTLAEGLEGGVCESTFAYAQQANVAMHTVSEEAIEQAMSMAEPLGMVTEGSAAAPLAWIHEHAASLRGEDAVVVIVSGKNVARYRHRGPK